MESSSRQDLTFEDGKPKKTKGWFVKPTNAFFLLCLAIAAIVAVGLIVWFAAPREKCPALTNEKRKEACARYMADNGRETLCSGFTEPKKNDSKSPVEKKTDDKMQRATGLRLNGTYIPSHYNIELWPRLYYGDDFGFNGTVKIFMTVTKTTDVIVLHVDMLTVHNNSIEIRDDSNGLIGINRTEEDVPRHFYKLYMDKAIHPNGSYIISMSFNGTLKHADFRGFYRSAYKENNTIHYLVSTQFETVHARRAFPCFDEPALKATFNVTLIRRDNFTSISNMPIRATQDRGDGWKADVYERTVVMQTYLLAFVVSQFTYVENVSPSGTKMRVWARPSFIKYAEYANSISGDILQAFVDWTGIPYSLPKMDQIAVPEFYFGAMENWGLVIYRENALLYNPNYTTMSGKLRVGSIIAHELAHQWFGNLVTCHWWDDIFLNEAFATYLGDLVGLHPVETTWKMDEYFLRLVQYIMNIDGKHDSQSIFVHGIEHHDDHDRAFHRITYYKGGSILRMIEYFLKEPTFKAAIRNFLNKYAFKTAVKEDLYQELQKQAELDNVVSWDAARTNLSGILDTWIEQMNFPLVKVTDLRTGNIRVEQSHFRHDKEKNVSQPSPFGEFIWDIPLTYITESALKNKLEPELKWIHKEKSIELSGLHQSEWKLVNLYEQGFYRVRYDAGTWGLLVNQLNTDHTVFPVENRASLLDDAFMMAAAGEFEDLEALRATQYIYKEEEYLPWFPAVRGRTNYYLDMFYGTPAYTELEFYLRNLCIPTYNRSGWVVSETLDNHLDRYTRSIAIGTACYRGYKPCIDKARSLYEQFMNNPDQNPIHPDLRPTVYCMGVAYGGASEWDFLRSLYQKDYGDVYIAQENSTIETALGCARQPHVIRIALDFALAYNLTSLFTNLAGRNSAKDTVWNYIQENWDRFQIGDIPKVSRASILSAVADSWNSEWDQKKIEQFISNYNTSGLNETINNINELINKNMEWVEMNMDKIEAWLKVVNQGKASETGPIQSNSRRRRSLSKNWHPVADGNSAKYTEQEDHLSFIV